MGSRVEVSSQRAKEKAQGRAGHMAMVSIKTSICFRRVLIFGPLLN